MRTRGGKINVKKIFSKNIVNQAFEIAKDTALDTNKYVKAIINKRNNYPPKVRDILEKVGDKVIKSISIKRTPVSGLITGTLDVFSLGKFGKRFRKSFDELFHLFIFITLEDNTKVSLEKNEVINMDINPATRPKTETKLVNNVPQITINDLLDKAEVYMGKTKFFNYDAVINNCQNFIESVFKSNNIGDQSDIDFIKQDTEQLFENLPYLKKIAHTVTDIGEKVNVITTGAGILKNKDYVIQSVIFEKDKYNIKDAKKWLKENDYKYPKVDRTKNYYRFQQINPNYIESKKYNEYITKDLDNSGIKLIIAYKNKKNKISSYNMQKGSGIKKNLQKGFKATKKYVTDTDGLTSDIVNYGIPAATATLLGTPAGILGGPVAGIPASALGSKLGVMAADKIAKETVIQSRTGEGLKKGSKQLGRMVKGSKEAKEFMAKIRKMKKK
jgi:hypothetical protein